MTHFMQSQNDELPTPEECKRIRRSAGVNTTSLASQIGVTVRTLDYWESGRSVPRVESAQRWAAALAVLSELGSRT
jgi:DNA-binding transcriptional regulator YiaG